MRRAPEPGSAALPSFVPAVLSVPYEVWIECSLKRSLTRTELRTLCDDCTTLDQIEKALGAVK